MPVSYVFRPLQTKKMSNSSGLLAACGGSGMVWVWVWVWVRAVPPQAAQPAPTPTPPPTPPPTPNPRPTALGSGETTRGEACKGKKKVLGDKAGPIINFLREKERI